MMTTDEDKDTEELRKALKVFKGGIGATTYMEWPAFNAILFQLLLYPKYAPGPGGLNTTPANLNNSRCVRTLLMCKLQGQALNPFLHADSYVDKGFEMMAKILKTYSPSSDEDIYTNFVGLLNHQQQPPDSLDFFTTEIHGMLPVFSLEASSWTHASWPWSS